MENAVKGGFEVSNFNRNCSKKQLLLTALSIQITPIALTSNSQNAHGNAFLSFQAPKRERKKSRKKETDIVSCKLNT